MIHVMVEWIHIIFSSHNLSKILFPPLSYEEEKTNQIENNKVDLMNTEEVMKEIMKQRLSWW